MSLGFFNRLRRFALSREIAFLRRTIKVPVLGMFFLGWNIFPLLLVLTIPVAMIWIPVLFFIAPGTSAGQSFVATLTGFVVLVYAFPALGVISAITIPSYVRAVKAFFGNTAACKTRLRVAEQIYTAIEGEPA